MRNVTGNSGYAHGREGVRAGPFVAARRNPSARARLIASIREAIHYFTRGEEKYHSVFRSPLLYRFFYDDDRRPSLAVPPLRVEHIDPDDAATAERGVANEISAARVGRRRDARRVMANGSDGRGAIALLYHGRCGYIPSF